VWRLAGKHTRLGGRATASASSACAHADGTTGDGRDAVAVCPWLRTATFVVLLIFGAIGTGCRRTSARAVSLLGSTSIQPFAEMLAERYAKDHPGEFVEVQGGGSTAGLQAAENGLANIGMCSRSLTPKEALVFTPILIARDGLALVVNR